MNAVIYVHGRGGSAEEAAHYRPLFPDCEVIGLDYRGDTPWETAEELGAAVRELKARYERIELIANSVGAFFSMNAGLGSSVAHAYFISPIVDMKKLIAGMMAAAGVTEAELREKGAVRTDFGETLSWEYLSYVRAHPIRWDVPTDILYGGEDRMTDRETIAAFARRHRATLTVMEDGEHWFHTEEQLRFLDRWLRSCLDRRGR